ncbi:DUF4007 family protein [Mesorhizobium sp.]|uniref:DUF4007 family protein n=1 Tax=Mesorhizobium sp. TaxID=1871066 RepID=UPI000FE52FF6|nr:DUF4007 family protein [Mesorhizobium sp.]RWI16688.1 MAG: DUF4007 family protein [Mesorhizobium sp.]RWN08822.1 MAG: DUF4007 family protein [Mesorhizobium sp.]RWN16247.1 MAG: DUF4007 family protein [Mesorhizobium sp.]TIQ97450.1 MAG: DUF4007 family protein [Mesorhizobium sp.]
MRDLLIDSPATLRFSGHETFPLRLLWLKKVYDAVMDGVTAKRTFQEREGIARFGVGKNMAMSMVHWAVTCGVVRDMGGQLEATTLGHLLFNDKDGVDPFLEDPSTVWLMHNALCATTELTTFFYAFNIFPQPLFERPALIKELSDIAAAKGARATPETVKRDVEVLLRSYAPRSTETGEDASEPLLAELGLIRELRHGQFEFVRGPKQSLSQAVFAYALVLYWRKWHADAPTLSVEAITYGIGAPGRVFRLDDESVAFRLAAIGDITGGALVWTDTAGLRQVARREPLDKIEELELLRHAYGTRLAA